MNTSWKAPDTHLNLVVQSEEAMLTGMGQLAATAPTHPATRNRTSSQHSPRHRGWARYSSFLVAHIILHWTSRTVPGFDRSTYASLLTTTRTGAFVVIVQDVILPAVTFAHTYSTCKAPKSLSRVAGLMKRWTLSSCAPMVQRWASDVWAIALVVACAHMGCAVYPSELRVVDTTHAALLGVVGRFIFLAMAHWILELELLLARLVLDM